MAKRGTRGTSAGRGMRQASKGTVAPTQNVKGIGRLGQCENNLNPLTVDPKCGLRGGSLSAAILGRQGK